MVQEGEVGMEERSLRWLLVERWSTMRMKHIEGSLKVRFARALFWSSFLVELRSSLDLRTSHFKLPAVVTPLVGSGLEDKLL